jgi:hypothetical protein
MKDIDTLNDIKKHFDKTSKVLIYWDGAKLPDGAASWKYSITNDLGFLDEKVRALNTFRYWEIKNEETLLAIPQYVHDDLGFDEIEFERLNYPVLFYVH